MAKRLILDLGPSKQKLSMNWLLIWQTFGVRIPQRITGNVPFHEATLLKLNCDKALAYLNWHSTLNYKQCISYIAGWYKNYYIERWNATKLFNFTKMQILEFTQIAKSQNLIWAND